MGLKIRLARAGAKKRPYYHIVVADSRSPRDGRFIEKVGSYDPMKPKDDPARVTLEVEKIQAWLGKGGLEGAMGGLMGPGAVPPGIGGPGGGGLPGLPGGGAAPFGMPPGFDKFGKR